MDNQAVRKVSRLRTAIPQVLAVCAQNLILFDMGLCISFPTIAIPALQNSSGVPSLDDEQTSWFGSIIMICSPLGSVLSGLALERFGRKMSLMVMNIPFLLSWLLFYFVDNPVGLISTSALMGLGLGLADAPSIAYIPEISQPELRGMFVCSTVVFGNVAIMCMYLAGTATDWRTIAAFSAAVPIITIIALSQVPESPAWLMSRGRTKEAERSLCWLRGWVEPAVVQEELRELENYCRQDEGRGANGHVNEGFVHDHGSEEDTRHTSEHDKSSQNMFTGESSRHNDVMTMLKATLRPETMRPLVMVTVMSIMERWGGVSGPRPYMVQVFQEIGISINAYWATVAMSLLSFFGVVACMVAVPRCGKRPLMFLSAASVTVCCTLIGTYAYVVPTYNMEPIGWIPMTFFFILFFSHDLALNPMPWMLFSEVFPLRNRTLAGGIAIALNYALSFAASKTFLDLKASIGLHGAFWLYAAVTALGSVYLMFEFKETEGKSLQDIEDYYKKKPTSLLVNHVTATTSRSSREDMNDSENVKKHGTGDSNLGARPGDADLPVDPEEILSSQEHQQYKGSMGPSPADTAELNVSVVETARVEVGDGGTASTKAWFSRARSVAVDGKEE